MKSLNKITSLLAVSLLIFGMAEISMAQDEERAEAIQLYNDAQELAGSGDFGNSIELYREALQIARDSQLDDIVELVEESLPRIYQQRASNAYRGYQNERTVEAANRALDYFKESKEAAEEFGDEQIAQQATNAIPQLYYVRSVLEFRADNYEAAIEDLDTAIDLNPNYATAYYQRAIVMKKIDEENIEGFLNWYDQAIEVAERTDNSQVLNNARNAARDELIYRAVNLAEERNFSRAVELLNMVEQYDDNHYETYYRLAEISNERGNWSEGERYARRSLDLHTGGVAEKAKMYFELGTSLKGQGEVEGACSAFEEARHGDFTDPANHELQFELKCEGHTPTSSN